MRQRERRERASEGYKHGSLLSPFCKKGDRKRDWGTGNVLSSVHVEKGVCNAVESSGAKSQIESTCAAVCRERRERKREKETSGRREYYHIKWFRAYKRNFELATLFSVSHRLQLPKNENASSLSRRNHREQKQFVHHWNYNCE